MQGARNGRVVPLPPIRVQDPSRRSASSRGVVLGNPRPGAAQDANDSKVNLTGPSRASSTVSAASRSRRPPLAAKGSRRLTAAVVTIQRWIRRRLHRLDWRQLVAAARAQAQREAEQHRARVSMAKLVLCRFFYYAAWKIRVLKRRRRHRRQITAAVLILRFVVAAQSLALTRARRVRLHHRAVRTIVRCWRRSVAYARATWNAANESMRLLLEEESFVERRYLERAEQLQRHVNITVAFRSAPASMRWVEAQAKKRLAAAAAASLLARDATPQTAVAEHYRHASERDVAPTSVPIDGDPQAERIHVTRPHKQVAMIATAGALMDPGGLSWLVGPGHLSAAATLTVSPKSTDHNKLHASVSLLGGEWYHWLRKTDYDRLCTGRDPSDYGEGFMTADDVRGRSGTAVARLINDHAVERLLVQEKVRRERLVRQSTALLTGLALQNVPERPVSSGPIPPAAD